MAKTKRIPEAEAPQAGPSLTIQGLIFAFSSPYSEGHTLNANEASAMNNLRGENLRNNFAAKIKALLEPKDGPKRSAGDLTEEEKATLQAQFAAYDAEYVLSGKRVAKAPVDPVEREATRMAKEIVDGALRKKGIDKKALGDGQYDGYIQALLAAKPEIREEAKAYVARIRDAGDLLTGLGEVPTQVAAE